MMMMLFFFNDYDHNNHEDDVQCIEIIELHQGAESAQSFPHGPKERGTEGEKKGLAATGSGRFFYPNTWMVYKGS
jgi:hypothetical protein